MLMTFKQFAAKYPAFSEGSLRWMRFNASGRFGHVQDAFVQLAGRVLVDEEVFFSRVKSGPQPRPEEARG